MTVQIRAGDLAPVEDRLRWMLLTRVALAAAVIVTWQVSAESRGAAGAWLLAVLGWLGTTAVSLPAARAGRRPAKVVLTLTLLGDGVLLATAWWATGALAGPVGYLIVLHGVAVTLLASFRTGVKIAVWHSICLMLFLEATAAGLLGPPVPVPMAVFGFFLGVLGTAVLGTASFAAANERELRRRRYDSEVLVQFGASVAAAPEPRAVAAALVRFARQELSAQRVAALTYIRGDEPDDEVLGFGTVADGAPGAAVRVDEVGQPSAFMTAAVRRSATFLRRRLGPDHDPWLAGALSGARGLVVVPFAVDRAFGVLVMEPSMRRWSRSVERRAVNSAEQATAHAALALERALLMERIRAASYTDGLTGVANRRRFDEVLTAHVQRVRESGGTVTLVMIDVDHFKRLNDTYGHLTGDQVLRQVAQAITAHSCGGQHTVARYGGEEFAVILADVDVTTAVAMAERIRTGIAAAQTARPVTASLGVAGLPVHGASTSELLAAADAALYRAKEDGRNRVVVATPAAIVPPAAHAADDATGHPVPA